MFVYPNEMIAAAAALSAQGHSDRAVGRQLGISRGTARNWRIAGHRPRPADGAAFVVAGRAYAYLLGQYLGDGHIVTTSRRAAVLAVTVADGYPAIADEVKRGLEAVFPGVRVRRGTRRGSACSVLAISSPAVPVAFPQHGPGRKHERHIALVDWQRAVTHRYPEALLRGLIHSDGSRCLNRFKTGLPSGRVAEYEYVRYFFTNYSADIRRIFCDHCDLLGIRWTQSNPRNVSVSHRESVAILDQIVGPKS